MKTEKYVDAIGNRIQGHSASRFRALAMAAGAGFAVATLVYRVMREPDD
jgi:hypothetical protein